MAELISLDRNLLCGRQFPAGFKWGVNTAAYAVEGAWNEDGKGESIWDRHCHSRPELIQDRSNGDVTCDSYHRFAEDVQLLKDLHANCYRFSISWTRIFPDGLAGIPNELGVAYYNRLIDACISNGIQPIVTLLSMDTPQALEEKGGWLTANICVHFRDYARFCFSSFGDRVKHWITMHEPQIHALHGYGGTGLAPAHNEPVQAPYTTLHHMLQAHALAYEVYQQDFKASQGGKVGISLIAAWCEPKDPSNQNDVQAAYRAQQFLLGWAAGPIFLGDYPAEMRTLLQQKCLAEGVETSRLPEFTATWKAKLKGSADFLAIASYTTVLVEHAPSPVGSKGHSFDQDVKFDFDPSWPSTQLGWAKIVPWGLRRILNWVKSEYDNPEVLVGETGVCVAEGLNDTTRAEFFKTSVNEVLKAVELDSCNVTGYIAFTLLDGFVWDSGYTINFGIHHVDHASPEKTRTPKMSAKELARIFSLNGFEESPTSM